SLIKNPWNSFREADSEDFTVVLPELSMTHFLKDILRQSEELRRTIGLLSQDGGGRPALEAATAAIRGARHIYLTGIGSSWHAALVVPIAFDHAISVNTYTTLALAAGMLASSVVATPGQNGKKKADSPASGYGGPQPEGRNDKSGVFRRESELVASLTQAVAE